MDAHYDAQIQSLASHHSTFSGPARQMGAGGGLGAFAVRMGKVAIPVIKKYILPVAKQVGKNLLEFALPEMSNVLSGKKRVSRKMLKSVVQYTAERTLAKDSKKLKAATHPESSQTSTEPQRAGRNGGGRAVQPPIEKGLKQPHLIKQRLRSFLEKVPQKEVGPIFCPKFNSQQFESRTAISIFEWKFFRERYGNC